MISVNLISTIYNAASIQRWNDYPRMVELTELDKQAHKFIIAYFLASYEDNISLVNMIEAGIFEFLRRVIVTDIRPDVYRRVIAEKKNEINEWVLQKIEPMVNKEFFEKISVFFKDEKIHENERKLLAAAHYLATRYEFNIVYQSGKFLSDIENLKDSIDSEISDFLQYKGVVYTALATDIERIIDLCGRLRFQIRWSQTPRLPKTSVLGHQLIVAIFSYFFSVEVKACQSRLKNNFFCALFHDLAEVLTRDIISPVKSSVDGLNHLIANYEIELITKKILPLVPSNIREHFSYILGLINEGDHYRKDEFMNRFKKEHFICFAEDINLYNEDRYEPIDGRALKACDHLAAFCEAALSISYGIKSRELENGLRVKNSYTEPINGIDFGKLMREIEQQI
ncbi:MAG: HD domain-containing protein [Helicobacteraceae bacterium]|nr:HD domain-containing protein [Helicobacteraceae bacterium]